MSIQIKKSLSFLNSLKKIPLAADAVDCLFSAKSFKAEILTLIEKAQKRIYLTALYLEADEAGKDILLALHQAKRKNPDLDIVVCIDFHRAQRGLIGQKKPTETNASWYQEVEKAEGLGIKILGVPVKRKELFGVQHLKGFIFDNKVLYSGASFNNIYLHQEDRYRYDRYWLIDSPKLANSMVEFLKTVIVASDAVVSLNAEVIPKISSFKMKQKSFSKNLKQASYRFEGEDISTQLSVTPLCGLGIRKNALNKCIRKILQSSEKKLVIFTPYFNLPNVLARDLSAALNRGVKLTIVIGDKTANDFYIPKERPFKTIGALPYLYETNLKRFTEKHYDALQSGQIKLHLWKSDANSFHLKGIYADERFVLLTGHNLNPRAWRLDIENALLIDDPKKSLQGLLDKELSEILKNTLQITTPEQIDNIDDYPAKVQKILRRLRRFKADRIIKGLI